MKMRGVYAFMLAAALPLVADGAAPPASRAAAQASEQERVLAVRAAQIDALRRLTEMVLAAHISPDVTVAEALRPIADGELQVRVFLRSARLAAEPRLYSDGLAEVDVEMAIEDVSQQLAAVLGMADTKAVRLDDLASEAIDGCLQVSGAGRAPADLQPEVVKRVMAARPDEFVEMFPAGWEDVTAAGRVGAIRDARARAHQTMASLVRSLGLGQTGKVADLVGEAPDSPQAAILDMFIRSLPMAGPPQMMPDRVAEVEVVAQARDLLRVLKEILALKGPHAPWTEQQIDQISVRLKADRLTALGRGMPAPGEIRTVESPPAGGRAPLPDWATEVFEARATARLSDEVPDRQEARILAARSAKARALAAIEKRVDTIVLDGQTTVRQRAARDDTFRRDLKTFLSSARTVVYRPSDDKKGWEVMLRLPLLRLYEFSRPRD